MQPTMMARSDAFAPRAAIASASVRPPALSSLMLTASYLPASAASEARSCALSSAQTGIVRWMSARHRRRSLRQRLFDQRDAGLGAGGEISLRDCCRSSPRWHRRSASPSARRRAPRRCAPDRRRAPSLILSRARCGRRCGRVAPWPRVLPSEIVKAVVSGRGAGRPASS